jgi:SAM-dependent methyltransferase
VPGPVADGWNHNTHYHDLLLESVPRPCRRALDVGCGLGTFVRRLSPLVDHVDAIDGDVDVIRQARDLSTGSRNVRFIHGEFMSWAADETYDIVSMIAVLHHLPFDDALDKAARLLRPGGVLLVLGLHRAASPIHLVVGGAIGVAVSRSYQLVRGTAPVGAPIREPSMTLGEIRRSASTLLPGARIRRHVLWRYSLVWTKDGKNTTAARESVREQPADQSLDIAVRHAER